MAYCCPRDALEGIPWLIERGMERGNVKLLIMMQFSGVGSSELTVKMAHWRYSRRDASGRVA